MPICRTNLKRALLIFVGIAFGAAIDYMNSIGFDIAAYENELLHYATEKLQTIDGLNIYGTSNNKPH